MKTKNKILIEKLISKILTAVHKDKAMVKRDVINWFLDLNEGIVLSIILFVKFESSIVEVSNYLIKDIYYYTNNIKDEMLNYIFLK